MQQGYSGLKKLSKDRNRKLLESLKTLARFLVLTRLLILDFLNQKVLEEAIGKYC